MSKTNQLYTQAKIHHTNNQSEKVDPSEIKRTYYIRTQQTLFYTVILFQRITHSTCNTHEIIMEQLQEIE